MTPVFADSFFFFALLNNNDAAHEVGTARSILHSSTTTEEGQTARQLGRASSRAQTLLQTRAACHSPRATCQWSDY